VRHNICHDEMMTNATVHTFTDLTRANSFALRAPYDAINLSQRLTRFDRKLLNRLASHALNSGVDTDEIHTIEQSVVHDVLDCRTNDTMIYVFKKLATTLVEMKQPQGWMVGMFLSYVCVEYGSHIRYRSGFLREIDWYSSEAGIQASINNDR